MTDAPVPDLFAVLGLPRRFEVEVAELERRFHERSRLLHPDRFARATLGERRIALERATRLNDAYRTLKEPRRRAAYLVSLLETGAPSRPMLDEAFLEEQLAVREALAAARGRGDRAVVGDIATRARAALDALDAELPGWFAGGPPGAESLAAIRCALARSRYHEAVFAEADAALAAHSLR